MILRYPGQVMHRFETVVRVTDLNYGNHLANHVVQVYLQEARMDFLRAHGLSEFNVGQGASLIQGDVAIVYQSEGFLADVIEISLTVAEFGNASFDMYYQLLNLTRNAPLAIAKTRMVCFDYGLRTSIPVPKSFISIIHGLTKTQ
ncbi:MAG: thioesterase family protein [Bacteroidetes bacterium]|nr:thioesterase family protein [Bacteroidota bacterium]